MHCYLTSNRFWCYALCVTNFYTMFHIQELTVLVQQLVASVSFHEQILVTSEISYWSILQLLISASIFKIKVFFFWDTLIRKIVRQIVLINNFRGDQTDTSARKEALLLMCSPNLIPRLSIFSPTAVLFKPTTVRIEQTNLWSAGLERKSHSHEKEYLWWPV